MAEAPTKPVSTADVEIAEVLDVTESSVRSRLFRARNLLAELLQHPRSIR